MPDHSLSKEMVFLMAFFTPFQGLMNAVVYGMNRKVCGALLDCVVTDADLSLCY